MLSSFTGGLIASALAYLTYVLFTFRDRAYGTTKRRDPRFVELPGWPLLGELPALIANLSRPLEHSATIGLKLRPGWSVTLPGVRMIDISKPEWLEYVQKTNFQNYIKGSLFQSVMGDVFGNGIFVTDGEIWKRSRQATACIFSVDSFKTIMVPSVHETLDSLTQVMTFAAESKQSLDLCDVFPKFTLESFVKMTFGKDLELLQDLISQDSERPNSSSSSAATFVEAFEGANKQLDVRFTLVTGWEIMEKLDFRMGKRMRSACNILNDFAYSLIDEQAAGMTKGNGTEGTKTLRQNLLGLFMTARDERGGGLGRTELRDAVLNMIIAGRDTTAQTLCWAFYHLLMNDEIVLKIRGETKELFADGIDDRVTYDNYRRFVWTQAVVFETLRLHPSVPKNVKFAVKADQIPGGPAVEAGDGVRWSDWTMGRDPQIWGEDSGEFRPERWIDESGKIQQFGQFKFHAFNGGPRVCPGMNLATYQAVAIIVEMLGKFDIEFAPGWLEQVPHSEAIPGIKSAYPTPAYKPALTLHMAQPMLISIKPRGS